MEFEQFDGNFCQVLNLTDINSSLHLPPGVLWPLGGGAGYFCVLFLFFIAQHGTPPREEFPIL